MPDENSKIPHLRICATEKCNNNCLYCRPGGEASRAIDKQEMSLRQIFESVSLMANHGITHLKITGGEPLVRDDIPKMIELLNTIKGIEEIQLVTRSPKVGKIANQLRDAGLHSVNFSLDTLDATNYLKINRHGRLDLLLQAIEMAHQAGLALKFNMVVMRNINDHEIESMIEFAGKYNATLKLLDLMNMPGEQQLLANHYMPFDDVIKDLNESAIKKDISRPPGGIGTPMYRFEMSNNATVLIKDARVGTWYSDVCMDCKNYPCQDAIMALRLTSDGCLQRCLLRQDNLVDILGMIERVRKKEEIDKAIDPVLETYKKAVYYKSAWKQ